MNKRYIIGGIIIAVALIAAFGAFQDSLTAYVDFAQARTLDRNCQIIGDIVKEEIAYDNVDGHLRFPITDEDGDRMLIRYAGPIPGNLEQAKSVVAIGQYVGDHFAAERLLVKCPSKYQGLEEAGETNPHEQDIDLEQTESGADTEPEPGV
jgi:cytochrome c-type biogenesis protein CcmE